MRFRYSRGSGKASRGRRTLAMSRRWSLYLLSARRSRRRCFAGNSADAPALLILLPRDHRQHQRGRVLRVVVDPLLGLDHAHGAGYRLARIQVPVEARKVAARYIQPDAVARLEQVAGGPQID